MVSASAYGSSSDDPELPGLDPDLPYNRADLGDWWESRWNQARRRERHLEWWQSLWDVIDGVFRRLKLRGLREQMRRDPDGMICPNCLHWDGRR